MMQESLTLSGCPNSAICKEYEQLEPLRKIGLPPRCPYRVELTKGIEFLGREVPKGTSVCIESMKIAIPDLSGIVATAQDF